MKHIPLATPTMCGEEMEFIKNAFDTNWIAPLGPHVDAFEKSIADFVGTKYAFATGSGTSAIHLALIQAGVKKGDTVISSDMTFSATCNPAVYQQANIVFVDSNERTFNMDVDSLKIALEAHPETKVVLAAHLYGQSCDMDPIIDLCQKFNCILIEDSAEALGSTYKGKKCGSFGKYSAFSFNGNKIITTSGGGMVVSNDEEGIKHIKFLATQARDPAPWYQHSELGYNYRMSNVCAAIGRGQFTVLKDRIARKRQIFATYEKGFKGSNVYMMPLASYGESNCWLSAMLIKPGCGVTPLQVIDYLKEHDVESRPIWKPMHMQPFYQKCEFFSAKKGIPMDEDIFARGLCLPSDVKMTEEEQQYVISLVIAVTNVENK